ncbi:MAG: hypothetical protein FWG69_06425 [Oscillospiraceae bacterium]|nr:hypothetical protein [Oscillospiraceae bacterium]
MSGSGTEKVDIRVIIIRSCCTEGRDGKSSLFFLSVSSTARPDYTGVWLSIATIVAGFIIQAFLTLPQQQILWLVVGILVLVLSPIFFLILLVGMVIFALIAMSF